VRHPGSAGIACRAFALSPVEYFFTTKSNHLFLVTHPTLQITPLEFAHNLVYLAHRRTNTRRQKHNLFGGGNNICGGDGRHDIRPAMINS